MPTNDKHCTPNLALLVRLATACLALGCSDGADHRLGVGSEPDAEGSAGNDGGFRGGAGSGTVGEDDNALRVRVQDASGLKITIVTLRCDDECADVEAVASGGNGPYTYAWEDGSTNAKRRVCADAGGQLKVSATDTEIASDEFSYEAQTVSTEVPVSVLDCTGDGGVPFGERPCSAGAGRYAGTFTCVLGAIPFTGTLELTLSSVQDGMSLTISDGRMNATAFGIAPFAADLVGTIDCSTSELDAKVENGVTGGEMFDGTMHASYSPTGPALIDGTWHLASTSTSTNCSGTWNAMWQP